MMFPPTAINWLAIIICVLGSLILGMLWYSPSVFGNTWMKLAGVDAEKGKANMGRGVAIAIVGAFIQACGLSILFSILNPASMSDAIQYGLWFYVALIIPIELSGAAWELRPWKLVFINAGWELVSILMMTIVIYGIGM